MTATLTNLTPGAMDLPGGRILPGLGSVTGEFEPEYLTILGHSLSVVVSYEKADPLEPFRAEYERLTGKKADGRWSEERLFTEIEKHDSN